MRKSRVMCINNFGPSLRFLGVFVEFPKIKSSPKTGVSQITKYLNINPILTSHLYIQKIIASMTCFCKTFISSLTSQLCCNKNLLCKWRHYPTVTTLPDLTVLILEPFPIPKLMLLVWKHFAYSVPLLTCTSHVCMKTRQTLDFCTGMIIVTHDQTSL